MLDKILSIEFHSSRSGYTVTVRSSPKICKNNKGTSKEQCYKVYFIINILIHLSTYKTLKSLDIMVCCFEFKILYLDDNDVIGQLFLLAFFSLLLSGFYFQWKAHCLSHPSNLKV